MGCSSSKETVALPANNNNARNLAWSDDEPSPVNMTLEKPVSASSRKSKKSQSKIIRVSSAESSHTEVEDISPNKNAMTILKKQNSENSLESLADETGSNRGVSSATSKSSAYTYDSGLEVDCPGMITENSDRTVLEKIETEGRPTTPGNLIYSLCNS